MKIKITIEMSNEQLHEIGEAYRRCRTQGYDEAYKMIGQAFGIIYEITEAMIKAEAKI